MRIRFQTLLAVTPVFLLLAVGINTLISYLVYRETRWGLEEGVSSVMVSAAAMMDKRDFRRLADGGMDADGRQAFLAPVRAILRLGQVAGISGFSADGRELFAQAGPSGKSGEPLPASLIPFDPAGAQVRLVSDAAGRFRMCGAVPVLAGGDTLLGYLAVRKDAGLLIQRRNAYLRTAVERSLAALCLGIVCALLISHTLKSRIGSLQRAVKKIGQARYDIDLAEHTGLIREMNDLGNSVNTMVSILKDTVARGRQQLTGVGGRNRRTELSALLCAPEAWECSCGNRTLHLQAVGAAGPDNFAGIREIDGTVFCFFGRLRGAAGFEAATRVSAFKRYLVKRLFAGTDEQGVHDACVLFGIGELTVARLENGAGTCRVSRYGADGASGSETRTIGTRPLVLHNLGAAAEERFALYCHEFCACRSPLLLQELVRLVDGPDIPASGMLVMITDTTEAAT